MPVGSANAWNRRISVSASKFSSRCPRQRMFGVSAEPTLIAPTIAAASAASVGADGSHVRLR